MKKIISLTMILILTLLCLSGCGSETVGEYGSPLKINDLQLDGEIFAFYLDDVYSDYSTKDERIGAATEKCIRYVAVNSTLEANGLSLTDDEIATATEEADNLWNMFGVHYKAIGVSKATFVKIYISGKYTEKLRNAFYGQGGTEEIEDKYLRGALREYYVAYKTISVPLYTTDVYKNEVPLPDTEKETLRHEMSDGASKLNNGQNIESVASEIAVDYPSCEYSSDTIVSGDSSHDVTAEFLASVRAIEEGKAGTIETDKYIIIIQRSDILADTSILEDKREECLKILSDGPLESKINEMCNGYSAVRSTDIVSKYYSDITAVKNNQREDS